MANRYLHLGNMKDRINSIFCFGFKTDSTVKNFPNSSGAKLDAQISVGAALGPIVGRSIFPTRRNGSVTIRSCFFDPTFLRPIEYDFRRLIFIPRRDINVSVFLRLSILVSDSLINTKSSTKAIIKIGEAFCLIYPRR